MVVQAWIWQYRISEETYRTSRGKSAADGQGSMRTPREWPDIDHIFSTLKCRSAGEGVYSPMISPHRYLDRTGARTHFAIRDIRHQLIQIVAFPDLIVRNLTITSLGWKLGQLLLIGIGQAVNVLFFKCTQWMTWIDRILALSQYFHGCRRQACLLCIQ